MKRPLALLFVAALLLAGCAGQPAIKDSPSTDTPVPEAPTGRPGVELTALVNAGSKGSFPAIFDHLNPPLRVEEEPIENRHVPSQVDTLRTYFYDGLHFTVYDVSASGKKLLQALTVTSDAYEAPQGIQVDMTRQEVEQQLGAPDDEWGNTWIYHFDEEHVPGPTLHIPFESDIVSTLKWSFYVD